VLFAMLGADGRIADPSLAWTSLLGWRREELLGRRFAELAYADDLARVWPDHALGGVGLVDLPIRIQRRDGGWQAVRGHCSRSPQGLRAVVLNRCGEDQERRSDNDESRIVHSLLAEAAGVWSWSLHDGGRTLKVRGDASKMLAAETNSLGDILAQVHPDDAPRLAARLSRASGKGGAGQIDCRLRSREGAYLNFRVTWRAEPSPEGGFVVHGLSQEVTEQVAARDRAEEIAERLRIALGAAQAGVCEIDFKARSVWCPDSVSRLIGRKLEFPEAGEPPWPMCHPDDLHKILAANWRGDQHEPLELRMIHPDGSIRWVELHGERQLDDSGELSKIIALVLDIDARKRQELALIEARQEAQEVAKRLKIAMDAARAGVFETDFASGTFWCSPEFAQIVGRPLSYEEAAGIWPIIHPEDAERVKAAISASQEARGDAHAEWRIQLPSGEYRWVEVYGLPQYGQGPVPLKLTGVVLDVDARKRQELALLEAQRSAEAAAEAKAQFLANMSHEIRTPMNGVMGVLHLLGKEALSDEGRKLLAEASNCGRMLSQLLNDVIDFSRIEAGRLDLAPEPLDPAGMVESVVELLRPQAEAKGLSLTVEVVGRAGWVMLDPVRLRQALFNLIGNAVKFTVKGRVEARLRISPRRNGMRRLRFEIADTGVGIPQDVQAALFQRFTQGDSSSARRFGGSGLGLAITKRLAELMGGKVGFESEEGQGSTFWFEIPAAETEAAPAGPEGREGALGGVRILLVEDNPTNRLVASKILESLGAEVQTADDGVEGVQAVQDRTYDLVLMDVQMPRMDGMEATRRIRALKTRTASIPIIAMTANVLAHQRETYLAAGMDGVAAKPISPSQLIEEIAAALAGARRKSAAA
jgi:signal transduction histidine kinase/CheY-like chemotaxis protein